ncbi:MAG: cation:proton antiporter, partial [Pygmaiobacter massiliensis]|nr:cation:proton antiporter [Pygmaiobacter massiliensis]
MIFSLSLVFLVGLSLGGIARRLGLPSLLGMLFTGILLGPFVLDLLDPSLLGLSADLRRIALLIILTRAGLSLDLADLRRNGRPALLLCFVPACFEIAGVLLLAPLLLGFSLLDAAILGTVLAAVSPAVIVPKMLSLMEQGYGTKQGIPQMVMAGASVDDVFVIVLFTVFTGVAQGGSFAPMQLLQIPASIVLGALVGLLTGGLLSFFFEKVHLRDSIKVL